MSELPEWVKVGAEVATVTQARRSRRVQVSRIARILKRDIVLEDGQRFNRSLEHRSGSTWDTTVTVLAQVDDPYVTQVRSQIRRENIAARARRACNDFDRGKATAAEAILALAPLTGVGDEIAALFESTEERA